MALLGAAWIPLWFFLNLYLQTVLDLSAFGSGLALLPMTIVIMVMMVRLTGPLIGRFGVKPVMVTGLVALAAALVLFAGLPPTEPLPPTCCLFPCWRQWGCRWPTFQSP